VFGRSKEQGELRRSLAGELETKYEKEIVDAAFVFSFLPTVQSRAGVEQRS
jgi:hypothetical protein